MQDIVMFIQHHMVLVLGLILVLFVLIILEFIKAKQEAARMSPMQVIQLINRQNAAIIDIRNKEVFTAGHIIGAISMPVPELAKKISQLQKFQDRPIIIVCANGVESLPATRLLAKQGIRSSLLAGGIQAWREAEMPLVKGE